MSTMLNEFSTADQNQVKDHISEQNDLSVKSCQGLGDPPEFSLDGHAAKQVENDFLMKITINDYLV